MKTQKFIERYYIFRVSSFQHLKRLYKYELNKYSSKSSV